MSTRLLIGDCRETLPTLADCSVQACITSPPYYGLRDYGTEPLVWSGDPEHAHEWQPSNSTRRIYTEAATNHGDASGISSKARDGQMGRANAAAGDVCHCGAWLGSHGLEPTPELFIEHEVEIFREVRRVLRDDGVLWLNLGDSYAGSGKGPTGHNGIGNQEKRQGFRAGSGRADGIVKDDSPRNRDGTGYVPGYKAKDLMMIPFRVAMALQADGWYLRSVIPWLKRNSMPESVTDRPATAVEYVFLLSANSRYYYDADAVRVPQSDWRDGHNVPLAKDESGVRRWNPTDNKYNPSGRNLRNADFFFQSWQGLLADDEGDPLALVVNPAPFTGAHFATFPAKLVEPMIKASTHTGDVVLDPFGGAGTVGLVADRMNRNAVLCELKSDYADMGAARITGDAPLFAELEFE